MCTHIYIHFWHRTQDIFLRILIYSHHDIKMVARLSRSPEKNWHLSQWSKATPSWEQLKLQPLLGYFSRFKIVTYTERWITLFVLSTHEVSAFTNNTAHFQSPPDLYITLSWNLQQTNTHQITLDTYFLNKDTKMRMARYCAYSPKLSSASYGQKHRSTSSLSMYACRDVTATRSCSVTGMFHTNFYQGLLIVKKATLGKTQRTK